MKKNLLIILDPAHGEETPGKRSPDGRHREYRWSRERLRAIAPRLEELGYKVVWTNNTDREIGLKRRQNTATRLAKENGSLVPFLISLHNDAAGNGTEWKRATGISVWTSKKRDLSDEFADIFISKIPVKIQKVRQRVYDNRKPLSKDFEANFTVLLGSYSAILIECMFQDNKNDVVFLENKNFQNEVESWIVESIEDCNKYIT